MAGRPTQQKRLREQAKQQKQKDKAERRAERQRDKETRGSPDGADPDLAGIVPGPQPLPSWMDEPGAPSTDGTDD